VVEQIDEVFERRFVPVEGEHSRRDAGRVAGVERAEVAGPGDIDEQVAPGQGEVGAPQGEHAGQTVLVEVVVGDGLDAVEQLGPCQRVERDLGGEVVAQVARRLRPRPVRKGEAGGGVRRPVDHDIGHVFGLVVGHEGQRPHPHHRSWPAFASISVHGAGTSALTRGVDQGSAEGHTRGAAIGPRSVPQLESVRRFVGAELGTR
jgi:hypothetical protein